MSDENKTELLALLLVSAKTKTKLNLLQISIDTGIYRLLPIN